MRPPGMAVLRMLTALALTTLAGACQGDAESPLGRWRVLNETGTLEFLADGRLIGSATGQVESWSYEILDSMRMRLVIDGDTSVADFMVSGDSLAIRVVGSARGIIAVREPDGGGSAN